MSFVRFLPLCEFCNTLLWLLNSALCQLVILEHQRQVDVVSLADEGRDADMRTSSHAWSGWTARWSSSADWNGPISLDRELPGWMPTSARR
jgi:hypothetical protein